MSLITEKEIYCGRKWNFAKSDCSGKELLSINQNFNEMNQKWIAKILLNLIYEKIVRKILWNIYFVAFATQL